MDNEGVGKKLQTNGDVTKNISLHKRTLLNQLEVAIAKFQETMNKMAKSETMAKCMGLAIAQLVFRETHFGEPT